ncbi:DUF3718 domain-containing protein [Thalassotalea psychrophila]|uniref:DUF3718 domain-containing protein n=1 Tax=Thalassotalea psychrophila TaxID=3065647 RepID=A0ABY9U0K3_9GAMM|nr:DUF3718 domain-containing protein [Colwelliaceae bacterium SQ149]
MKTLTTLALAGLTSVTLLTAFTTSAAPMSPYMESALISVCKSAQSNNLLDMRKTIKSHRLSEKTVALKVVCNGEDIISFAENSGADKTANHLEKRLGDSSIVDIAQVYAVNF